MLTRLKIERFKSIRNADITFGRVNLFIGANGAGKSNILEAIGLTSAMLSRGISAPELGRKGIRLSPAELMKSAHKNRPMPKHIELEAYITPRITYKCNLTSNTLDPSLRVHSEICKQGSFSAFGRSPRGAKVMNQSLPGTLNKYRGAWDQIKVTFPFGPDLRDALDSFSRFAIYSPQTDFLRGRKSAPADDPPIGLHGEGLPDAVLELIRQRYSARRDSSPERKFDADLARSALDLVYLPGWTRGVRVGSLESNLVSPEISNDSDRMVYFLDRFMRDDRNKLSAYDSSEGTLFLLFAAVLLAHTHSPKYFALDNVDSALNPAMTRKLVESIIDFTEKSTKFPSGAGPSQVFMTSHNPTSLDAFDLFNNDQRAFIVSRDFNSGDTKIRRLEPREGMTRAEWSIAHKGKKLSQLWLDGAIPGINGRDDF